MVCLRGCEIEKLVTLFIIGARKIVEIVKFAEQTKEVLHLHISAIKIFVLLLGILLTI